MNRERVTNHLNECMEMSSRRSTWAFVRKDIVKDAITLLKEQETIVRCKNCKHRPKEPDFETYESGFDLEFPEGSKCPCRCNGDEYYSWYPEDDWFCGSGERKNDDA